MPSAHPPGLSSMTTEPLMSFRCVQDRKHDMHMMCEKREKRLLRVQACVHVFFCYHFLHIVFAAQTVAKKRVLEHKLDALKAQEKTAAAEETSATSTTNVAEKVSGTR